ncbi:hypothetical protein R3Q06_11090 [Rhodococcus erythropolis]|uniref:hypothetical protein n=1 Tax=Rhodococcus erythropolis TaxID=1833 RepID=UPI00294930C9|nr:hypothetical protein [Rhodococcus erythropolis]MDV6274044.1 hypothetical protein [Rhodococcus erythropolis]
MTDLTLHSGESPFDSIREVRADGTEFWDARKLQPVMGYSRWEDFQTAIERAKLAAENSGLSVEENFRRVAKVSGKRGPTQANYELSRYAAYLTALNGDPSKPESAAAQSYFVIRAREAEVHSRDIDEAASVKPLSGLEYALALVDAERRAEAGAKFQRAIEGGDGIGLRVFHKKYFSSITEKAFFAHLYGKNYLIDQRGKGSMRDSGPRAGTFRDGSQHSHPSFKGKPWLYLHTPETFNGYRKEQTRVRPGRYELDFRDHLAAEGLAANENTTGLFGIDGTITRELSA